MSRHPAPTWIMLSLSVLSGLLLAACGGPTAAPQAITLLEWSGYELPEFSEAFTQQYPAVTPDYSFFAEDAEAFTKAESGFHFDLVHPCINYWQLYVDQGLVQPLDTSRLKNWPSLRPELTALGKINGQQYFVPYDWGFESMLVRTDKVQNIPTAWADLWKPEYAGHVSLYDSGEANFIITALVLGFDPWNTTPAQNAHIKQKLIDLKPNLLTYWVDYTDINQLIINGDVWVGSSAWQDAYVAAVDASVPVEYILPHEGRIGWVCGYGLSTKVQNVDLAYGYLDARLDAQASANFANAYAYGVSSIDALPLIDPNYVDLFALDDPSVLQSTVFYQPLTEAQRELMTSLWSDVKAAP